MERFAVTAHTLRLRAQLTRTRRAAAGDPAVAGWAFMLAEQGLATTLEAAGRVLPRWRGYMRDARPFDWRYLLPDGLRRDALCCGGALSPLPLLLARSYGTVTVVASPAEASFLLARSRAMRPPAVNLEVMTRGEVSGRQFDLVAIARPAPGRKRLTGALDAARLVRAGGCIALEVDAPAALRPPARVRGRLQAMGFSGVSFYWPKPSFDRYEMYLQMYDRRLQRYYLNRMFYATSLARRLARLLLLTASRLGLFELTLPGYVALARRDACRAELT